MLKNPNVPFSRNWPLHLMMTAFAVYWCFTAFSPTDRTQWMLESLLPVSSLILLAITYRKFRFTNLSYFWIFVFLCLHTYAAHYTYQGTPFDVWLKASFHTQRSYFDRVGHFAFGLLLIYPMLELLTRLTGLRKFWSYFMAVAVLFALQSLFEIVEMLVALVAKQAGQEYVGIQGDIFDSQKDSGSCLFGSLLSIGGLAWVRHRKKP
jgi:putative membrane protein